MFSSALSEMDLSPELADPLLEVASAGLSAAQVHIQSQPLDPQNLQPRDLFISTRTLHRIPKASRPQLAPALTQVIKDVLAYNDISSWKRLMQFAGICLQRPKRAGKKSKSPASVVNGQLKNFLLGLVPENQDYSANKPSELRKIVSAKLSDMDIRGAVRLLSSDAKLLSSTPETMEKLKKKHPEAHTDTVLPLPPEEPGESLVCTREDVLKAIKSFRNGSGGGPDGLLPQHLKDLTAEYLGQTANSLLDALMDLLNNIIFAGKVPSFMVPIFYGADLIALSKDDGGVRPIAIGNTIRRLAGKVAMTKVKEKCPALLHPNQLGVALPGGAEIGVHTLRQYVNHSHSEDKLVAKIDFRNAFNTIRRDRLLEEVKEHTPS